MERDVKSFFKGAALDPLGRLNSPSPLSLRDISPHCGESPQTLSGSALPEPRTTLPLASSLTSYKRLTLLSAGNNRGDKLATHFNKRVY